MAENLNYEELKQKLKKLEKETLKGKQAQKMLKRKITELDSFINNIPDMAWIKDESSRFIAVNRAFGEAVGIDEVSLIHQTCEICFGKEGAKKFREDDLKVMKGRTQKVIEEKIIDSQNNGVWLETVKSPILDQSGKAIGTVGISRDISKRKRAEERLQQAHNDLERIVKERTAELVQANEQLRLEIEERKKAQKEASYEQSLMQTLLNNIPDYIYFKDKNRRFVSASSSFCDLFGCSLEDIIGKKDEDLFPTEIAMESTADDRHVTETGIPIINKEEGGESVGDEGHWILTTKMPWRDRKGNFIGLFGVSKDITDRKQTEEALRKSGERYALATSAAKVGVWDWNIKTGDFYLDPNIKTILGYTDDEIPNDVEKWVKYLHPEDSKAVMEAAQACLDGKTSEYIFEHRMLHKDGSIRWILVRGKAIRDESGNAVRLIGTDADITDRKRMEKALWESEEVYRTLVENANSVILKWDTNGHIIYLNPYGLEYFKYRKEEVIGKHVIGTIVPKNENTGRDLSEMIDNITKNPLEYKNNLNQNICSDCEFVWVEWTNEAILDASGKLVEILSIGNDVTERKLAQEALRKSELWLNRIFNSLEEAVLVVTPDRKLANINEAAKRMFGYSRAELRNLSTEVLHVDHEHYLEFERRIKKAFDKGEAANFEFEAKRKNGEIFPTKHTDSLLKNKQGEPLGIVSVVRDITGQKREEEEKKTLEAQLQRAEKMEAIGTLAGGVAHDLNNVLSGIVSYPDLLLMDLPEDSPLRKPILTMQIAGQKAVAIVQDLLTMARRGVVIADVVNLNDIISKYLQSLEYENLISFHPGVEVKIKLEADLPNLSGSSVHLSKIVMNLVSNAAEAMPHGGKIFISTENRYVDRPLSGFDSVEEGDYVVLTVSDPGAGISAKDMKRIFEPFYTKKVMGRSGTGLGMAVVWGTVKDHNGYIDVQSTERKGTTFTLYFPATQEEIAKEKARLSIEDYMGKEESILAVDDVKEQRELALTLLTKLGYAVDTVSSGVEAVEYLKEHRVDLIVLDMIMDPGIDGLDTYKKIIEVHPRQKAIIASGFSETDRVKEAQRLGAGQYIKKPYTLEKIGLAVKEELGK